MVRFGIARLFPRERMGIVDRVVTDGEIGGRERALDECALMGRPQNYQLLLTGSIPV